MWARVAARGANLRRMSNANDDSDDARLTREVVGSVMHESRAQRDMHPSREGEAVDEMVLELERDMQQDSAVSPHATQDEIFDVVKLLAAVRQIEAAEAGVWILWNDRKRCVCGFERCVELVPFVNLCEFLVNLSFEICEFCLKGGGCKHF